MCVDGNCILFFMRPLRHDAIEMQGVINPAPPLFVDPVVSTSCVQSQEKRDFPNFYVLTFGVKMKTNLPSLSLNLHDSFHYHRIPKT